MRRSLLPDAAVFILAGLLAATSPAQATLTLVTSAAALNPNDSINWSQLGPAFTSLTSPLSVVSSLGLAATVTSSGGVFQRRNQGNGWSGNFAPGTPLLWDDNVGPQIVVTFATPVSGAGAQIQSDSIGAFTAVVMASNGAVLGSVSENGYSSNANNNSAIFIGILSNIADIAAIEFDLTAGFHPPDFAIGTLEVNITPMPEPISLGILGAATAALGAVRRRA